MPTWLEYAYIVGLTMHPSALAAHLLLVAGAAGLLLLACGRRPKLAPLAPLMHALQALLLARAPLVAARQRRWVHPPIRHRRTRVLCAKQHQ